jgi:hypothetical protein
MRINLIILLFCTTIIGRERLGVFNLQPLNISEDLVRIVSDKITYEFQQLDVYDLVERQEINRVLSEQQFQNTGATDSVIEIGKLLNIQSMVIGSFGQLDKRTWFISLKVVSVETGKVKTGYYTVDGTFRDFVIGAPKSCVRQLLKLDKAQVVKVQEAYAPASHVNVIQYIQKEQPRKRMFMTCVNCSGAGTIWKKQGNVNSPYRCSVCQGFKYSGPETNYRLVAGKFESW